MPTRHKPARSLFLNEDVLGRQPQHREDVGIALKKEGHCLSNFVKHNIIASGLQLLGSARAPFCQSEVMTLVTKREAHQVDVVDALWIVRWDEHPVRDRSAIGEEERIRSRFES